jgi:polyisoprenoid-binding protein YceI
MKTLSWPRWARPFYSAALLLFFVSGLPAQQREIDKARSTMTVRVAKTGMLSALGHDHEISAPIGSGAVDTAVGHVDLHVHAAALRVADPNGSEKDRQEIQKNMVGPEVLDADRYPEISFRSKSAEKSGPGWTVAGELTLHGQTRLITLQVTERDGHFVGSARLRQSEYGIKPIKVAGGTVRVKDEIRIDFDIRLSGHSATSN